ncbi:MAG: radical SAM protein [Phycisphaeraceae bacterium]
MHDLGRWSTAMANRVLREGRQRGPASPSTIRHPQSAISLDRIRTYIIDRNINYTNVCTANCTFCAFKRDLGEADSYTLTTEQLQQKVRELVAIGGTQVLLQGGMHPDLPIEWYEDMLRGLKAEFPQVHIHGFSPPEVVEFVALFKLDNFPVTEPGKSHTMPADVWSAKLEAILRRLMAAGLDSIPGGGGEIFAEPVRRKIGLGKATSNQWLDVMAMAHRLGMYTSATMMFGHIEGVADRIDHMARIRDRQDRAIAEGWPGRYVAFISWPFQRENTPLGRVPDWDLESGEVFPGDVVADSGDPANPGAHPLFAKRVRMSGATDYLRTQAISRLFLDNIHSIGSSWVTMGPKIGQLGLYFGATDMGSVMMEENVVSAAGTTYCLNESVLCKLIRDSGYTPAQRDNRYNLLRVHDGPDSPDLSVSDWSQHRAKKLHVEQPA